MNIQLQYGIAVATVPAAALAVMDRATKSDLKVLLTLCAKPALSTGASLGECVGNIAASVGCAPAQVESALSFWRGAGVLNVLEEDEVPVKPAGDEGIKPSKKPDATETEPIKTEEPKPAEVPERNERSHVPHDVEEGKQNASPKPRTADALPHYNSAELATLLESREEAAAYLDECQNVWGKMFNIHEYNIILALTDYLGLEWDYVLTLLAFCVKEQDKRGIKRSLRYVETRAFTFYDEGVTDLPSLQEKIRRLEQMEEVEGQLRRMFGMGERSLTPTEKKKFSAWLYEYKFGMDIITRAFEITVDTKGSPNLKYMDAILANWDRDGLRTLDAIQAAEEKFRAGKKGKKPEEAREGSFNTEDFFAAAVRRSFGEDFDPDKKNA